MLPIVALLALQVDPLAPLPATPSAQASKVKPRAVEPVTTPPADIVPTLVHPITPVVVPKDWRAEFAAIRAGDWAGASAGIAALPDGPLKPVARAQLYLAKGSPAVPAADLEALLAEAPDLPQAEQIRRLAVSRGSTLTLSSSERPIVGLAAGPRRTRARPVTGEPLADQLRTALDPLLKTDAADAAEALMLQSAPLLTPEARAEAGQRVAWSYYGLGRDRDAVRVAEAARTGATGEWAANAAWVSGLASWRQNDCQAAEASFRTVTGLTREPELAAAANYWAARAAQACRRPEAVESLLQAAARSPESFYGLLARETLGMPTRIADARLAGTDSVERLPNVQRAAELTNIGERGLAEQMLRYQARLGRPGDQRALIAIAERLDLPGAQYWLATNGQPGVTVPAAERYPRPRWVPQNGWRVDPALALGHVLQESNFRTAAVSQAGAVGLMQVRPGTAGDSARARGATLAPDDLTDPATNLDYGQSFIDLLRRNSATRGQLPRVIAAYNAGPVPVARWSTINDKGDPLLWIESIPYWETRYYVPSVMRNMWVYQGLEGKEQRSLHALAQHQWPMVTTSDAP